MKISIYGKIFSFKKGRNIIEIFRKGKEIGYFTGINFTKKEIKEFIFNDFISNDYFKNFKG